MLARWDCPATSQVTADGLRWREARVVLALAFPQAFRVSAAARVLRKRGNTYDALDSS